MPRLPTRDDLGGRPLPSVTRGLFTYQPTPLPDPGKAYEALSGGLAAAGQAVGEIGQKIDAADLAKATSTFLQEHAEAEAIDRYKDGIGDSSGDGDPAPPPPPVMFGQIYRDRVNRARDKAAEGISNPLLRQRFVENTDKVIERGTAHVGGLAETRAATVGRATLLATLDGNLKAAGQAATGPTRADLIFTSVDLIDTGVAQGFLTPAEGQALRKTWPERYGMAALRALPAAERLAVLDRIEAGSPDPAGAPPAAIDRVAGFIGPEGRSALRARAALEAAEARQGLAAEVAAATGPEIEGIKRTGQETPGFSEKARAVLGAVDMDALGRRTRIAKATHAAGQNMRFMTPEDMTGVADAYRPAGDATALSGPEGPAGDATAEAAETHAAIRAEAEAIKARRAADPAGYAMQHPAVRAAFNAALGDGALAGALSGGDGATLQRAIALRQSLQDAMGIAPADRRMLANDERREMIALLDQAAPEQKPALLRQLRQALGAQADDAIAEMVDDGLDGGMELIARTADHPALAAEAAKAMATPYAELVRGIEPEDVKALDARLAERVGPWRAAIEKQPGGSQRAAQQSAVVMAVALSRLAQTGDADGAVIGVFQELIDRDLHMADGFAVPRSLDNHLIRPNRIATNAENILIEASVQKLAQQGSSAGSPRRGRSRPSNSRSSSGSPPLSPSSAATFPPNGQGGRILPADYTGYLGSNDTRSPVPTMPAGEDVDINIARAENHKFNIFWFRNQVNNHRPWDYKRRDMIFENFGNFNYGATGAALGVPDNILLRLAGWVQESKDPKWGEWWYWDGPYGDDPKDQHWIMKGIEYYRSRNSP